MGAPLQSDPQTDSERLDVAANEAIALANGDVYSAIRMLILVNEYLEAELVEMAKAISKGYEGGRKRKPRTD